MNVNPAYPSPSAEDILSDPQQEEEKKQDEEKTVETAATVTQHFDKSSAVWPIEGDVLLDYSISVTQILYHRTSGFFIFLNIRYFSRCHCKHFIIDIATDHHGRIASVLL